jgi:UDP-3-O-[3-hydroxymyristoyl] glucosamine N-acyltransferase
MALKLKELAALIGGEVVGDGEVTIQRVAPIEAAGQGDISFVSNPKYVPFVHTTGASAVIVSPQLRSARRNLIVMMNPYLGFAKAVGVLMAQKTPRTPGVHPAAIVSPAARLGKDVAVGPGAVIEDEAEIGDNVTIMAGAYIGRGVCVDEGTVVNPNVTLYRGVRIGKRCIIHANVSIGSEGFGWAPDGKRYVAIPQVGATVVGDDVSIGAGSIINRGALGNTSIGRGTKIDSLVMISHNVEIGEDCLFVSQVGVSGSVKIGNHVTLGGQVGIAGHLTIGDNVQVAAQSGVSHDLEPNNTYLGSPARPINQMRRTLGAFNKLPELRDEIRNVQKRMEAITALLDSDIREGRQPSDKTASATRSDEETEEDLPQQVALAAKEDAKSQPKSEG